VDLNPTFVGLELVPATGGPFKAVSGFRRALGGNIISFTSPENIKHAQGNIRHVQCADSFIGRRFHRPLRAELAKVEPDVASSTLFSCHILFRFSALWVYRQARKYNVPYWVVPHGCLDPYVFTYRSWQKRIWMKLWGERILRDAAHVIYATHRELEKTSRQWRHDNARVIHWPVEVPDGIDRTRARAEIRKQLGIEAEARVLVYLGRLHSVKRPRETIEAFTAATTGAHLVLIGPDGDITRGDLQPVGNGKLKHVHIVGPVYGAQKETWLTGADGFISLSAKENFNHAAAEAMAHGVPVILSRGNDLATEIGDMAGGWHLQSDEPAEEARCIGEWGRMPIENLRKRGEAARAFARSRLSFEQFRSSLLKLHAEATVDARRRSI
jgi:glycosyltransferase involved in cell wall biosynthesis